jgi:hypothetical protein
MTDPVESRAARQELAQATDWQLDDAYADPMALRGLLYQLTGDEEVAAVAVTEQAGITAARIASEDGVTLLRAKAAAFLKRQRDAGAAWPVPIGPRQRGEHLGGPALRGDHVARLLGLVLLDVSHEHARASRASTMALARPVAIPGPGVEPAPVTIATRPATLPAPVIVASLLAGHPGLANVIISRRILISSGK